MSGAADGSSSVLAVCPDCDRGLVNGFVCATCGGSGALLLPPGT